MSSSPTRCTTQTSGRGRLVVHRTSGTSSGCRGRSGILLLFRLPLLGARLRAVRTVLAVAAVLLLALAGVRGFLGVALVGLLPVVGLRLLGGVVAVARVLLAGLVAGGLLGLSGRPRGAVRRRRRAERRATPGRL